MTTLRTDRTQGQAAAATTTTNPRRTLSHQRKQRKAKATPKLHRKRPCQPACGQVLAISPVVVRFWKDTLQGNQPSCILLNKRGLPEFSVMRRLPHTRRYDVYESLYLANLGEIIDVRSTAVKSKGGFCLQRLLACDYLSWMSPPIYLILRSPFSTLFQGPPT